jgi:hypothetical protein
MFIHPALTWGFFLALVPLLIHLINLVRRRRVKWAAMTFLLQSYKKHQKWVWLQQLILLFLRMAAVAIAVAMLAQWVARSHWFSLFGGRVTHHYVVLDDSFSMSERFGGAAAFDKATQSLSRIAAQAMAQDSAQKFTLVRFSRAAGFDKESTSTSIGQLADLNAEVVDANFDVLLEEKRQGLKVTELATEPRVAFELAIELVRQSADENNVLHVLSDFRHKDWSKPAELAQLLKDLDQATEQIHFINCAPESQQGNLAITELRPAEDIRAAGVPLFVQVTVKNFGTENAAKIPIRIRTTYYDPQTIASAEPGQPIGKLDEPPAILIDELPPGQSTTRQFQVLFPRPGEHVVEAMLPDDVVVMDNRRWCVVNVEERESILVIEGEGTSRDGSHRGAAYYLQSAFEPGSRAVTGIRVVEERPAYLRDATPESLAAFRAIYLLDVDRLEDRAVENLEAFVRAGGGLGVFLGEHAHLDFYNKKLYRDGEGPFPLPLERAEVLPPDSDENVPDLEVSDHPLFSVLLGEQNPFIRLVNIDRYVRPPLRWSPDPDSTVSILARLRNRQPLTVERRFGEGRVVVFLTTLSPQWNNWANDPSFVVVLLKLQSYLAAPQRTVESHLVGSPLRLPIDAEKVRRDFVFVAPGPKSDLPLVLQRAAVELKEPVAPKEKKDAEAPQYVALLPGTSVDDANSSRAGVYELWQTTIAGPLEVRRFAFNVDPAESDLLQESSQTLMNNLSPIQIRMRRADELVFDLTEQAGFSRSGWLLVLLLVALLGEQFLAYIASYHPAPLEGAARK